MAIDEKLRKKYDKALELFIEKVKQDRNILAVYVFGSYVNGTFWERSDIDTMIVTSDSNTNERFFIFQENDVSIHAFIYSRESFRRTQQRFIHGSLSHHVLATSRLVYSADKAISDFNRNMFSIAERDKELQMMLAGEMCLGSLHKAQKTLYIEKDVEKCFIWLLSLTQRLASIVLLMNGKIPGRDMLAQSRDIDSVILDEIMKKTFKPGFNEENLDHAIKLVEEFLLENKNSLWSPLFNYLAETGDARPASEIDGHFSKVMAMRGGFFTLAESYEWLTHHGDLMLAVTPKRITTKSRITADESSFYYIGGDVA
ncbi:MAG: nucleotidyltransferase domain-containing protein [Candidatus Hodarchaeales archaeon]|jgi:predicted nucleotidyltransferase